jgi:hypothetical protein
VYARARSRRLARRASIRRVASKRRLHRLRDDPFAIGMQSRLTLKNMNK